MHCTQCKKHFCWKCGAANITYDHFDEHCGLFAGENNNSDI